MKPTLSLALAAALALTTLLGVALAAATPATLPALKSTDIPRDTQSGPAAPGGGRAQPPVPANAKLPTLWLIGDSTVRNGTAGDGTNLNQWGWGAPLVAYFDLTKINVVNRAFGGTSSRSFYGANWKRMVDLIQKGDFVLLQFGANDNGGATGKGALPGVGDNTAMNGAETVHSFGWYLQQYVAETRAKGATPIICSLTPRKGWTPDGHFVRANTTHAAWAGQVAKTTQTPYVDLYELIARSYEVLGPGKVDALYVPSPTEKLHTGWDGAVNNAECVVAGLKNLQDDPLAPYLSDRGQAVAAVDTTLPAPPPKPAAPATPSAAHP